MARVPAPVSYRRADVQPPRMRLPTCWGVVLAGGRSRRMGEPKPLLTLEGATFLARVVQALREGGCAAVLVVAPPPATPAGDAVAEAAEALGARSVRNPRADAEPIDSLRVALRALPPEVEAVVSAPVDVPGFRAETVRALIEAFGRGGAPVVLPAHRGRHGHPVLFARGVFSELLAGGLPEGARSVVHAHAADHEEVPVDDAGVLHDVDTRADYRRLRGEAG